MWWLMLPIALGMKQISDLRDRPQLLGRGFFSLYGYEASSLSLS